MKNKTINPTTIKRMRIAHLYYNMGIKQAEIAGVLGISQQRVSKQLKAYNRLLIGGKNTTAKIILKKMLTLDESRDYKIEKQF